MKRLELHYHHDKQVAQLILHHGKGNIVDSSMLKELQDKLNELKQQKTIKLITIEGAGKHFSFGASIKEHKKEHARDMLGTFHKTLLNISEVPIPVLIKVSGYCLGGAMELALAANLIFADETAVFGQPEVNLSVFPPPASLLLPLKIGYPRAEELLLTGRNISAKKAADFGLVNQVFEDREALDKSVDHWIKEYILPKSATALHYATRANRNYMNTHLREYLPALESLYLDDLMETSDANEGIHAFIEKRDPVWEHE